MSIPVYATSARTTLSDVLAHEAEFGRSREAVTLLAGDGALRSLALGTVLGKALFGAATATPAGGNTGDGTVTGAAPGGAAKVGHYVLTCIASSANAGTFQVVDPEGYRLPDATVGVAYGHAQIGFTIGDGAADWAVGDTITLALAEGTGKVVALDLTATDGTQLAHGVLGEHADAADGVDRETWAIVREAVVVSAGLQWPAGITASQQIAALARLETRGILAR